MRWFGRWIKRFEERGGLLSAMLHRTGASLTETDGLASENIVRQAINRCLACRNGEECKAWLETATPGAKPPDFCPNAALIAALTAQKRAVWPAAGP